MVTVAAAPVLLTQADQGGEQPLAHRHEHCVEQRRGQPPHLGHQGLDQHGLEPGHPPTDLVRLHTLHHQGLGRLQGDDGGVALRRADHAQVAEPPAGPDHPQHQDIASGGVQPDRHPAAIDQVQGVTGIALVEDITSPLAKRRRRAPLIRAPRSSADNESSSVQRITAT